MEHDSLQIVILADLAVDPPFTKARRLMWRSFRVLRPGGILVVQSCGGLNPVGEAMEEVLLFLARHVGFERCGLIRPREVMQDMQQAGLFAGEFAKTTFMAQKPGPDAPASLTAAFAAGMTAVSSGEGYLRLEGQPGASDPRMETGRAGRVPIRLAAGLKSLMRRGWRRLLAFVDDRPVLRQRCLALTQHLGLYRMLRSLYWKSCGGQSGGSSAERPELAGSRDELSAYSTLAFQTLRAAARLPGQVR